MFNYGATNRYLDDYPEQEPLPALTLAEQFRDYLVSSYAVDDDNDAIDLDEIPF